MADPSSALHPADVFARQLLVLTGAIFAGIGLASLFAPDLVADFLNMRLDDALARFDFRAVYGGLQCGIGAFLVVSALRTPWRMPALNLSLLVLTGLIFGRLVSVAIDEPPGVTGWILLGLEVSLIAVLAFGWVRLKRARAEQEAQAVAAAQTAAAQTVPSVAAAEPPPS